MVSVDLQDDMKCYCFGGAIERQFLYFKPDLNTKSKLLWYLKLALVWKSGGLWSKLHFVIELHDLQ